MMMYLKKSGVLFLFIVMSICSVSVLAVQNCSALPSDVTIMIDAEPYIQDKTSFLGVLPDAMKTHSVKCWSYVSRDGKIQQTNPQKTSYSETFFSLPHQTETREYFSAQNGMVNAYFTQKNLVAYTEFVLGLRCVDESNGDMVIGETCIVPYYDELKVVPARSVWAIENMDMLVIIVVFGVVVIILLGVFWRGIRKALK